MGRKPNKPIKSQPKKPFGDVGGTVKPPTPVEQPAPAAGDSSYSAPGTPPETTPASPSIAEVNPPGNADSDEAERARREDEGTGKV